MKPFNISFYFDAAQYWPELALMTCTTLIAQTRVALIFQHSVSYRYGWHTDIPVQKLSNIDEGYS